MNHQVHAPSLSPSKRLDYLLLWVFILSGLSGLIYQSIWTQYLGLFLGHSAHAQSLVLILFMGGMALGAWLASRYSERLTRPLLAYAAIELLIGLFGLVFDRSFQLLSGFAYDTLLPALGSSTTVTIARWGLCVLLVLPACILLGATFPLMSAAYWRLRPTDAGKVLAGLYFSNSLGAALGALTATYLLLPKVGLPGAVMSAGLLNILVALLVYPSGKRTNPLPAPPPSTTPTTRHTHNHGPLLGVAALTGTSSFVYEIVWVRMLSLAVGTTLHAFELMLAAFIFGIAFGGLWLRGRADQFKRPLLVAGWVQVFMGIAALASLFVYANAFEWVGYLMRSLSSTLEGYVAYNVATAVIALLVMFPAAFFAGMTLPLLTLSLLRQGGGERAIGHAYAANTIGAIIGVLLAVHVLMPLLGVKLALWLAAAIDLLLGLVLLAHCKKSQPVATEGVAPVRLPLAAALSLACLGAALLVRFDPLVLASSVYRTGTTRLGNHVHMHYYRDGKTASVAVYEGGTENRRYYSIATNGKVDAGLMADPTTKPGGDEYTMVLLPALPIVLKQDIAETGVIGFGSGMTTHTLLASPRVKGVDTVEIEPAMLEGARVFKHRVARAFDDPRSHIIIDDAKAYFSSSRKRYDLLISEPSNPWMGGTASLFSEEFYQFVPRHLKPDGLFVQWLQLYEIDMELVSSVLHAMLPHFSDIHAYLSNDGDLILVAAVSGKVPYINPDYVFEPELSKDLARIGIHSARDMQDNFVLNTAGIQALAQIYPARPNSDFFPILQLNAPRTRFMKASVGIFGAISQAPWPISAHLGGFTIRPVSTALPTLQRDIQVDTKLRAAREIRTALLEDTPIHGNATLKSDAIAMDALRGLAQSCKLDYSPVQASQLMFSLAMETTAFLPLESESGIWNNPSWIKCPPTHPLVSDSLQFLAATARGDDAAVITFGRKLLDRDDAEVVLADANSAYYIRGSMQFAALRLGDQPLATRLVEQYDSKLPDTVRQQPLLKLLNLLSTGQTPQH